MNIKDFEVTLSFHTTASGDTPSVGEDDYYEYLCVIQYDEDAYAVTELGI